MAKKRTKAQRSAAAKKAWAERRAAAGAAKQAAPVAVNAKSATAVREGDQLLLVLSNGTGDQIRFPLSEALLYKVSLEGMNLVTPPPIL